jgi:hypothetical protein
LPNTQSVSYAAITLMRAGTRARLAAEHDLDVLIERGQECHQALDRKSALGRSE